jgi:hypothetical protein
MSCEPYLKQFNRKLENRKNNNIKIADEYKPGFWGSWFTKLIAPGKNNKIKNKMGTMKAIDPSSSELNVAMVMDDFGDIIEGLLRVLDEVRTLDIEKIKIKTLLGNLVKFRMGDAFTFTVAHMKRHTLQAIAVLEEPDFPKNN